MSIRIRNNNASAQTRFVPFVLPLGYVEANSLGDWIDLSSGGQALKQWDDGQDAIYVATDTWASGLTTATMSAGADPDAVFSLHPAYGTSQCGTVLSWARSAIPDVFIRVGGVDINICPNLKNSTPTLRIDGNQMKQAVWESHFDGFHVYHAISYYSDQAIADVYTHFFWSDETYPSPAEPYSRTNTGWRRPCSQIKFVYGQEVLPKFLANEGWVRSNGNATLTLPLTFTNGSGSSDYYSWDDTLYHGRALSVRGWMFGRQPGVTVTADEDSFDVCDHLDGVASATEWEGYWQYGGAVPAVPTNPTDIVRPDYATTNLHYISWNRGTGGDDTTGAIGLVFARYANDLGLQGCLGLVAGGAVIHDYQRLYDYEAAVVNWGLRPERWVKRDGSFYLPTTTRGERLCLSGQQPHINGPSFTDINFGRNNIRDHQDTYWNVPSSGNNQDGFDGQHRVSATLTAYYQLAKYDYFAYRLILEWVRTEALNQRRGGNFALGSGMSGDREPARCIYSVVQAGAACPETDPIVRDLLTNPAGSYLTELYANLDFQSRPPGGSLASGWSHWMTVGSTTPTTTTNGIQLNGLCDMIFTALGASSLWLLWKYTGDARAYDLFVKSATSVVRDGRIYLPAGSPVGAGAADVSGWVFPYEQRVNWNFSTQSDRGIRTTDAQRTYGSSDYSNIVQGIGGVALRRWAIGGAYCISQHHPDADIRNKAREVYLALGQGTGTPLGWIHSYYIAAGTLPA